MPPSTTEIARAAVEGYCKLVDDLILGIHEQLQRLVDAAFSLDFAGPGAESVLNPELEDVALRAVDLVEEAVVEFAQHAGAVLPRICRHLALDGLHRPGEAPPDLVLPAPPGALADTHWVDRVGFDAFLSVELPLVRAEIGDMLLQHREALVGALQVVVSCPEWPGSYGDQAWMADLVAEALRLDVPLWRAADWFAAVIIDLRDGTLMAGSQLGPLGSPLR